MSRRCERPNSGDLRLTTKNYNAAGLLSRIRNIAWLGRHCLGKISRDELLWVASRKVAQQEPFVAIHHERHMGGKRSALPDADERRETVSLNQGEQRLTILDAE